MGSAAAAPRKLALLIGIGQYADAAIPALEGPAHDVAAVRAALTRHWGFAEADINTLQNAAATRAGILAALQQLETSSRAGDQLFIYFSGHGTSAHDKDSGLPLPHTSGAFIPYDLRSEQSPEQLVAQLIVGQRDLRPVLSRLDEGGRRLFVVSDSCYSGQAVRALGGARADGARLQPRQVNFRALSAPTAGGQRNLRPQPAPYPYRHVFYMAAASDSEPAIDIGRQDLHALPTVDNQPHGALTDALVRALSGQLPLDSNRDGQVDHGELFAAVSGFMQPRGYPHTPQALPSALEDRARIARARVFDSQPVGAGFGLVTVAPNLPVVPAVPGVPVVALPPNSTAVTPASAASTPSSTGPGTGPTTPQQPSAPPPLRLRVAGLLSEAQALLNGLAGLHWVQAQDLAPSDLTLYLGGTQWQLRGPAGDLVLSGPPSDSAHFRRRVEAALWWHRLQALARARQAFHLELQPQPASRGGSFVEGEQFTLALRSERAAHVLLLSLDAQGRFGVLYPYNLAEKQPHAADSLVLTPPAHSPIRVTPPFGTDELLALAYEQAPEFWAQLPHKGALNLGHPLLVALENSLNGHGTPPKAWAHTVIRALPRLP